MRVVIVNFHLSFGYEMKIFFVLVVVPLIIATSVPSVLCKNKAILIVALPHSVNNELTLSWERGQEILPGAIAAAEVIYNDSTLLPLKIVMVDSDQVTRCNRPCSGNILEVIAGHF